MSEWREIKLTKGQVALVSPEDFEELSKYRWCASWSPNTQSFYAIRRSPRVNGKQTMIRMHRQIMGFPEGLNVDHINGNTLDNRRSELRIATHAENQRNSRKRSDNTSGFKGVTWHSKLGRWTSQIWSDGSRIHLGYYDTPEEAHAAYCEASSKYYGAFGRTA